MIKVPYKFYFFSTQNHILSSGIKAGKGFPSCSRKENNFQLYLGRRCWDRSTITNVGWVFNSIGSWRSSWEEVTSAQVYKHEYSRGSSIRNLEYQKVKIRRNLDEVLGSRYKGLILRKDFLQLAFEYEENEYQYLYERGAIVVVKD